ncbi:MBL fold metallo-hydrolase [Paenibacillus turpanensis]|uniref:MBL fold metallo-hydrolase n=1 Tax=Paenibacillus turpanensis TaxID=2689078 RepID=UPI002440F5B2|nr:MBL fold metallo-hydrolase [Paenibacillus turpanensis]
MGDRYNYLIDTGLGSLSMAPVLEYCKNNDKSTIIINTHYHWDHIWGNHVLKDRIIVSHELCRDMIEKHWEEMLQKNNQYVYGDVGKALPTLTIKNELYFPDDQIRLLHTPGHTLDSISVLDEKDGVLHVGDNFGDSAEFLLPSLACEKDVYRNTILKYIELQKDFDAFISGHYVTNDKQVFEKILALL